MARMNHTKSFLDVKLLGPLQISVNGERIPCFPTRKAAELFAFLAINHNRLHHRDVLSTILWPESPVHKTRRRLSTELWRIHQLLGNHSHCIYRTTEHLSFKVNTNFCLDVVHFNRLARKNNLEDLRQAYQLYRGDFLEGCYTNWCLRERRHLLDSYLTLLENLVYLLKNENHFGEAILYAKRILDIDALRESIHRILMKLYIEKGDNALAIAQFHICRETLQYELGIEPMQITKTLFYKILEDA